MLIKDVIKIVKDLRPGSVMELDDCIKRLNRLEEDIYSNIISRYEGSPVYVPHIDDDCKLQAPDMYCDMYVFYLMAMIDLANGDITRYSNSMILYNSLVAEYADWYNRNHTALQYGRIGWR